MRLSFVLMMLLSAAAVQAFAPTPKAAATTLHGIVPRKNFHLSAALGDLEKMKKITADLTGLTARNWDKESVEALSDLIGLEDASVLKQDFSAGKIFHELMQARERKPGDVLDGVTIPDNPQSEFNFKVLEKVLFYGFRIIPALFIENKLLKRAKDTSSFEPYQNIIISNSDLGKDLKGYRHFGDNHHFKSLTELLKTNPFFASGLSKSGDGGYELITYSPNTPENRKTRFLKVMDKLVHCNPIRANFYFHKDMTLKTFEVFDTKASGSQAIEVDTTDETQRDKYASATMYHMLFYASCQHATMHVLHYLATSALQSTSAKHKHLPALEEWSRVYANDIREKYREVGSLLIQKAGPEGKDFAVITGENGFGASQAIRPLLVDMLNDWGEHPTAEGWVNTMMNIDKDEMRENGILTEFWKHYDLVSDYAGQVGHVLRKGEDRKKGDGKNAENYLADYLQKRCGSFKCNISSFEQWTEMMAITGIVHGCTLSYTRAIGISEVLRWRTSSDIWDLGDLRLMLGGLGTICGTEIGRHVMGGDQYMKTTRVKNVVETVTGTGKEGLIPHPFKKQKIIDELKHVIHDANKKAQALKEEHINEVMARDDFNELGWIWTDFGKEGFDGKQLTMTTYI